MLGKLKKHWKVNSLNLALIIITFALGGSLCGYAARKILLLLDLGKGPLWIVAYILIITLLWPLAVLLISLPLGQFGFFKKYVARVGDKIFRSGNQQQGPVRVAIFASGAGSNAQQLIDHFAGSAAVKIALIVCNKPGAGVLTIAQKEGIPSLLIDKEHFLKGDAYLAELKEKQIDFIILAGFLWKMPAALVKAYPKKMINIHPALLPQYGGKGMYGHFVHEAVINNKEKESGISIHYVDELYDNGDIIFQAKCSIDENETPETLAEKIHSLEHLHYPVVTAGLLEKQNRS